MGAESINKTARNQIKYDKSLFVHITADFFRTLYISSPRRFDAIERVINSFESTLKAGLLSLRLQKDIYFDSTLSCPVHKNINRYASPYLKSLHLLAGNTHP